MTMETFKPMKALTLHQPWATALVRRNTRGTQRGPMKACETRPWPPGGGARFPGVPKMPGHPLMEGETFAVHAGKTYNREWPMDFLALCAELQLWTEDYPKNLALGAVVGTARFVRAVVMPEATSEAGDECYPMEAQRHVERVAGLKTEGWMPDMVEWDDRHLQEHLMGYWCGGRYAWLLDEAVEFDEAIPCTGHQGVWTLPREVAERMP